VKQTLTETRRDLRRGAWLLLVVLVSAATAEAGDRRWTSEPQVKLTGAGNAYWSGGSDGHYASLTASLGRKFASPTRPRKAGVLAAYRVSSGDREPDALLALGWATAEFSRWQTNLVAGYVDPRRGAGHLLYLGKLRFRVADEHWLGIEAMGCAGGGRPAAQLVYEGEIAGHLKLRIGLGLGAGGRSELLAGSEFEWRIGEDRGAVAR